MRGLQSAGVGATVKHFVANDSETERFTLDARVGERALREDYLAPFEAIVREARPWAVMAAYNAVNGVTMTESPMLRDVLKGEWGFDGVVMSDWMATRTTVAAGRAALDLAMPGPSGPWGEALVAGVRSGRVTEAAVDDKVERLLRLATRVGALEGVEPAVAGTDGAWPDADVAGELRAAAAAGFVLARNEGELLPLDRPSLRRVAVLGPNAAVARTLAGGSATVFPPYTVPPLDGLRAALGPAVRVDHAAGVRSHTRMPVAPGPLLRAPRGDGAGVEVRFLARDGAVLGSERRPGAAYTWLGSFVDGVPVGEVAAVEVRTRIRAQEAGDASFEVPGAAFQLNVDPPREPDDEELARAVVLAGAAEVAVVVVGTTEEVESEGFDRDSLALPGRQGELVRAVAQANARTVVVGNAGAPVLLPWLAEVPAVLLAWFPGQEFGHALADVLLGVVEPGGRLPTTWPVSEGDLPSTRPVDGVLAYDEGLFVGHRAYDRDGRDPLLPFGHGLDYTSWEHLGIEVLGDVAAGQDATVAVRLRNTGDRAGREVVQLYASRAAGAVERPRAPRCARAAPDPRVRAGPKARPLSVVVFRRALPGCCPCYRPSRVLIGVFGPIGNGPRRQRAGPTARPVMLTCGGSLTTSCRPCSRPCWACRSG